MRYRVALPAVVVVLLIAAVMIGRLPTVMAPATPAAAPSADVARAVAEAVSARVASETKARVLDPNLDEVDVRLLTDVELDVSPAVLNAVERSFPREPSPQIPHKVVEPGNPEPRYQYAVKTNDSPPRVEQRNLTIDQSLSPPRIDVDLSDPLHPRVRVPKQKGPGGQEALYYFEFDTSPRFDSPNFWQYPALMPAYSTDLLRGPADRRFADLTGREGLPMTIFMSTQRDVDGRANEARFAFRATAMRLPEQWSALTFDELERHALALGYGLAPREMLPEIYRYGRATYAWGWDTVTRSPIDVFRSGIAECSANNNLIGAMLEMNGIRYRTVEGINPRYRVVWPDHGHSAVEVLDPVSRRWSYLDSYLDVYLPDVSAQQLATGGAAASKLAVASIAGPQHRTLFGPSTLLGSLFKYRRYGDNLSRLPMTSALKLRTGAGEDEYGMDWTLNTARARPASELFAERQTIHVRARYVLAGSATLAALGKPQGLMGLNDRPVASPWGTTRFDIEPRRLMARYAAPATAVAAAAENLCATTTDATRKLTGPFRRELGNAYTIKLNIPESGDNLRAPKRSSIQLCEDTRPLGPAHAVHDEIRTKGQGRFSHWEDFLYFSTSDNSDPSTNGRTYRIIGR